MKEGRKEDRKEGREGERGEGEGRGRGREGGRGKEVGRGREWHKAIKAEGTAGRTLWGASSQRKLRPCQGFTIITHTVRDFSGNEAQRASWGRLTKTTEHISLLNIRVVGGLIHGK